MFSIHLVMQTSGFSNVANNALPSFLLAGFGDVSLSCDTAVPASSLRMSSYSSHMVCMETVAARRVQADQTCANMVDSAWIW